MKNFKKTFEPFTLFDLSLDQKQDLGTFLVYLRDHNITMDEAIDYIEGVKKAALLEIEKENKKQKEKQERWNKLALKCPECKTAMQLYPVNTHPSNQVDKELNSQWFCPKCWYEEYSTKTVREWIEEIGRKL